MGRKTIRQARGGKRAVKIGSGCVLHPKSHAPSSVAVSCIDFVSTFRSASQHLSSEAVALGRPNNVASCSTCRSWNRYENHRLAKILLAPGGAACNPPIDRFGDNARPIAEVAHAARDCQARLRASAPGEMRLRFREEYQFSLARHSRTRGRTCASSGALPL